jgi:hypothetical protein
MLVTYLVQGGPDEPETGLQTSVRLGSDHESLTLFRVRELFPYEGTYHFRLRVGDAAGLSSYVWLDLRRDDEDVGTLAANLAPTANGEVVLKVLPLSFVPVKGAVNPAELEEWTEEDLGPRLLLPQGRHAAGGFDPEEGPMPTPSPKMSDTTASIMKTTAQVAKMGFGGAKKLVAGVSRSIGVRLGSIPSPDALECLFELSALFNTPFSPDVNSHMALMAESWAHFFPGAPFALPSPRWREVGFSSDEAFPDLHPSGLLALGSISYMGRRRSNEVARIMETQKGNHAHTYPFAIVAKNLTLMLADVLKLRSQQFANERCPYWEVFTSKDDYYDVFCWAFLRIDREWVQRGATRAQFGAIIASTKSALEDVLARGPTSVGDFHKMAILQ